MLRIQHILEEGGKGGACKSDRKRVQRDGRIRQTYVVLSKLGRTG